MTISDEDVQRAIDAYCATESNYMRDMMRNALQSLRAIPRHLCGECAVGSYDGQVELVPPPRLAREDGRGICVDACLALEITKLWAAGITTTGCCCGHGSHHAYIGVIDADIQKMKAMGYVVQPNETRPGAEDSFVPKTPLRAIPRGGVKGLQASICSALLDAFPMADKVADNYSAVAAKAALSAIEQEQEPVAWRWVKKNDDGTWFDWGVTDEKSFAEAYADAEISPLYLSPSVCEGKVTEITDEMVDRAWKAQRNYHQSREMSYEHDGMRAALTAALSQEGE